MLKCKIFVLVALLVLALTGCKSEEEKEAERKQVTEQKFVEALKKNPTTVRAISLSVGSDTLVYKENRPSNYAPSPGKTYASYTKNHVAHDKVTQNIVRCLEALDKNGVVKTTRHEIGYNILFELEFQEPYLKYLRESRIYKGQFDFLVGRLAPEKINRIPYMNDVLRQWEQSQQTRTEFLISYTGEIDFIPELNAEVHQICAPSLGSIFDVRMQYYKGKGWDVLK